MQGELDLREPERPLEPPKRATASMPKRGRPPPMPLLPGLGIRRLDNLFFAIQPNDAVRKAIQTLVRELCKDRNLAGDLLAARDYHITVHGLGTYEGVPGMICEKAGVAAAQLRLQPFEVCFDSVMSFVRDDPKKAFVLRPAGACAALRVFHRALGQEMRRAGLHRHVRSSFTPHLTMAYFREMVTQQPICPIGWTVDRFVLIHSAQGQGIRPDRARHRIVREWTLG